MASHNRQHKSRKAKLRAKIQIGAMAQQELNNVQMSLVGGEHECCLAMRVKRINVSADIQFGLHAYNVPGLCRALKCWPHTFVAV